MLAALVPVGLAIPQFQTWVVPVVGAAFAGTALVVGLTLFGRRRSDLAAPPASAAAKDKGPARDPFVYGSAAERRVALRRGGNPKEILISDAQVKEPPFQAWVVDRSTGGLCLALTSEQPIGKILSVRALNAPETVPWVQVEVKSCRRVDRDWEAGCEFVRIPSWNVMLFFG